MPERPGKQLMDVKLSRRSLVTGAPVVVLMGSFLQVSAACSPFSFEQSTPEPEPAETPASVPEPSGTPIPIVTPAPASTPIPSPDPTPSPEPIAQVIRVAGTFLDPERMSTSTLPDCLSNGMTRAGLVRLSHSFELEPDWAESWEPLEDRDGWRFHIRPNENGWGDGVPLTAQDFADSWLSMLDPGSGSPNASLLFDIENAGAFARSELPAETVGIVVVDDLTLDVYLDRVRETFPAAAASPALQPSAPRLSDDDSPDGCARNGPFQVLSRDDESLSLEPSARYWANQDPMLERIELTTLSPGVAITEFRQGELDLIRLSGTDVTRAREDVTVSSEVMMAMPDRIILLIPDVEVPPFDSVEVRRALSRMIDRRRLELIVEGRVIPAQRMFPPGMFPDLDDAVAGLTAGFDVDSALEELAPTPYSDPGAWPTFGLDVPSGDSYLDRVARDVTLQFRENLGVQVPIRVHDPEEYAEGLRERRYPLSWLEWSYPYADPASTYGELFASWRDPDGPVSWSDEEYDELVRVADTLASAEERVSAYAGCEGLLQEHGACIPLVHPVDHFLVQSWIDGLPRDGRGRLIAGDRLGVRIASQITVNERPE